MLQQACQIEPPLPSIGGSGFDRRCQEGLHLLGLFGHARLVAVLGALQGFEEVAKLVVDPKDFVSEEIRMYNSRCANYGFKL